MRDSKRWGPAVLLQCRMPHSTGIRDRANAAHSLPPNAANAPRVLCPRRPPTLPHSLLGLAQTADLNLGWQYETNAKPKLVRLLASTAVYGAMGARAGAVLPLPGGHGSSGAGARPGGPGGVVAVPPVVASRLLVAGGPGEVGRLAGRLLGCLAGGLAAMEAADGYSRRRSAAVA